LDIDQSIYVCLGRLVDVIEDVTGQRPDTHMLLEAIARRAAASRTKRFIVLNKAHVMNIASSHANRVLANRVARWTLKVMGPDTPLLYSYPIFREMAVARGLKPWSFGLYRRHAWGYESRARGLQPGVDRAV
jgi:hypothetical protein